MKPLYDAILNYNNNIKVKFHMPGHSGVSFGLFSDFKMDLTEVPGLDNLLQSNGVIKDAEKLLAKVYGTKFALMGTSGTTCSMQITIAMLKKLGYKFIAFGKMHSSFYNALRINNLDYIEVNTLKDLSEKIEKNEDVFAVFITSPNYFGEIFDIEKIYKLTKSTKNKFVVDAAHGAHFPFSKLFPEFPGVHSDIALISTHKTLPCFGGSSLITCNSESDYEMLMLYRSLIHTTSPSYLSMASMDFARESFEANGEKWYKEVKNKIESFKGTIGGFEIVKNDDFSRLVLKKKGIDAYKVLVNIQDKGIGVEMAIDDKLVFIVTPFNYKSLDLLDTELRKINTVNFEQNNTKESNIKIENIENFKPSFVSLDSAVGLISNAEIGIYPPARAVIKYRQIITKEQIQIIKDNKEHLYGLVNNKVPVLK